MAASCGRREEPILPERADITASVYASATIMPDSMYQVYASVSGILEKNLVDEGDSVRSGAPLLHITDANPRLTAENARLQMELAKQNYLGASTPLKDLQAQIRTAELTYRDDSVNFRRQEKLWSQKIGSQSDFENRKLAYERSHNQLQRLRSEYSRLQKELRTQMIQAENTYRSRMVSTADYTVRSAIDGKVYALYKEPGEGVLPNEPLALIGSPDVFLAELLVDEIDIVQIKTGQLALLTLDAYPDAVFETRVTKIYPQKDARSQTFKIEARFEKAPDILYPGLSGEANIVIGRREGVLTIPGNYLARGDSVRTTRGMRKVVTGLRTLDRIEIIDGIDPTTALLSPEQ
jgi:multidrug efflux pump subunit AcrA (membrane-fusion protein)